jgi:pyruvate kinase
MNHSVTTILRRLEHVQEQTARLKRRHGGRLKSVHPAYAESARNLLAYVALRQRDMRGMQQRLEELGMSHFGNAVPHVEATLHNVRHLLQLTLGRKPEIRHVYLTGRRAKTIHAEHTAQLFGGRRLNGTRIMVTMPDDAVSDVRRVAALMTGGMNVVRINCATGGPETWEPVITQVKKASRRTGRTCQVLMDLGGPKLRTGPIAHTSGIRESQKIPLKPGDELVIHREPFPGERAVYDRYGRCLHPAHISCTFPGIFACVRSGDPIFFDDGIVEGVVRTVSPKAMHVTILRTSGVSANLRADKGINLPSTGRLPAGLTRRDRHHLRFVAEHADIVSLSFVHGPDDVRALLAALRRLHAEHLGVVVKIETQQAYRCLPAIVLAAMRHPGTGLLIARGDLAVECGWEHLARIQEEILMCAAAAHMPVFIATQVLEKLAKKGIPSRAEILDAAQAGRADCVMLNKGPHVLAAVRMLKKILSSTTAYRQGSVPLLPPLSSSLDDP